MPIQEIVYLIIAGVAGLLIGILIANLINSRGGKSSQPVEGTPEMKKEGYGDVARLWYSPATKKIITEMDNDFFREFVNLSPDQQKKAHRLSELFSNWIVSTPVAEEKPVEEAYKTPPTPLPEETVPQISITPARPGSTKPLPFVDNAPILNVPPSSYANREEPKDESAFEPFRPLDSDTEAEEPLKLKPKTIAGQISDIIDEIIQTSPLREKGIKLIERPDHGVDVWYGMEKFDGIEAIPYPDVKALIKTAAARWERESSAQNKNPG